MEDMTFREQARSFATVRVTVPAPLLAADCGAATYDRLSCDGRHGVDELSVDARRVRRRPPHRYLQNEEGL